ncbi:tetratricopeptide repeat protein [Sorangium sp. So ce861]|uniref:tetratricopeptide repeat protein n=1 Tax=Sorangium sp. So ce861 TaxID=3133323 RepID=UPI003F61DFEB
MTGTQKPEIDLDRLPAVFAAEARGESIGPEDAALLRRAEQDDPELRGEAQLWAAIGRLGDARGAGRELSDAAMLERVLARAHAEPAPRSAALPRAAPRPALRRGVAGTIAGAAAAATLLAALAADLIDGPAQPPPPAPAGSEALAPSVAPRAPGFAAPPEAPSPGSGAAPAPGEPPASAAASGPPGAGAAAVDPPATGAAPAPGEPPSRAAAGEPPSRAAAGEPPSRAAATAEPRDRAPQPPPAPRAQAPAMGPEALLLRAQARLAEGKTAEASAAYRALLAQHPSSPEARAALVSLGQIALHQGKAAEALGHFDRYLAGPGPLAAEARVGRVQCLRRLGRAADERAAIADFLARHGESVHAPRLRARLAELGGR